MRRTSAVPTALSALLTLLVLGACGEPPAPVNPAQGPPPSTAALVVPELKPLPVLHRSQPLTSDEVASALVGPRGAELDLPRAGLRVFIPPYAVARLTQVTVRARAGDLVGYEFEPKGLHFGRSAVLIQDLRDLRVEGTPEALVGAYPEGELSPMVAVREIHPVRILPPAEDAALSFRIRHLSPYVIAQGMSPRAAFRVTAEAKGSHPRAGASLAAAAPGTRKGAAQGTR